MTGQIHTQEGIAVHNIGGKFYLTVVSGSSRDYLFWDGHTWSPYMQNAKDAGMVWSTQRAAEHAARKFKMPLVAPRLAMSHRVVRAYLDTTDSDQHDLVRDLLLLALAMLRAQHWLYWNKHWTVSGSNFYQLHLLFQRFYDEDGADEGSALREEIDTLAEKIVGFFGSDAIDPRQQMVEAAGWLDRWCKEPDSIKMGLAAEANLQEVLSQVYEAIENQGVMTMGLDDFIMALASRHETVQYLLQQSMPVLMSNPSKQAGHKRLLEVGDRVQLRDGNKHGVIVRLKQKSPYITYQVKLDHGPTVERGHGQLILRDRRKASGQPAAPSAEGAFFDSPKEKVVREFAESGATTNDPEVAKDAPESSPGDVEKARRAPPIPTEIAEMPGGEQLSTLNQYVVDTREEGAPTSLPSSHAEIPKHPDIK